MLARLVSTPRLFPTPRLPDSLLQSSSHRRNPLRVEPEPVHPPNIPRVLDFQAAIHDDRYAALLRDARALFVDHAELTPERAGADFDGFFGDCRQGVRRAEDVHYVNRRRHVEQALVALLSEDLLFARVHGNDFVAMPLEVVAHEVTRAKFVRRQPDDGNRLRVVEHALDDQRILISRQIHHAVAASLAAPEAARANPCSRSQIRSSTDSVPTESLIVPGPTPAAASSASLN